MLNETLYVKYRSKGVQPIYAKIIAPLPLFVNFKITTKPLLKDKKRTFPFSCWSSLYYFLLLFSVAKSIVNVNDVIVIIMYTINKILLFSSPVLGKSILGISAQTVFIL